MQQHFEQFVGKERRLERMFMGISETELLRFDCVNLVSLQGQCRAQFRLIYLFQTYQISFRPVISKDEKHQYMLRNRLEMLQSCVF